MQVSQPLASGFFLGARMSFNQVKSQIKRLPHAEQIQLRNVLAQAGIAAMLSNKNSIESIYLELAKKEKWSYKGRQSVFALCGYVNLAMELTNEAWQAYRHDKEVIDSIEAEIERYFKPRGWICENLNGSPFWVKSIHKEGIIRREFVLHGIEAKTNNYVYVKANFDKITDNQLGKEQTWHFSEFSKMITFINKGNHANSNRLLP